MNMIQSKDLTHYNKQHIYRQYFVDIFGCFLDKICKIMRKSLE